MGKLQSTQETVSKLDHLYKIAEQQSKSSQNGATKSKSVKGPKARKKNAASPSTISPPPVIPLIQTEIGEGGEVTTKRVKPLTYSLMTWVKRYMDLPDTIDISDDEDHAQFEVSVPDLNEEFEFKCFFNTEEKIGLIAFYIYNFDDLISMEKAPEVKEFILQKNMECLTGQVQLIESPLEGFVIRYYSGIFVKGIASEDPNYSGEFQVSPQLYQNMFEQGFECMNGIIPQLKEILSEE